MRVSHNNERANFREGDIFKLDRELINPVALFLPPYYFCTDRRDFSRVFKLIQWGFTGTLFRKNINLADYYHFFLRLFVE